MTGAMTGRLIGVGLGPGDPDLMTLRAARHVGEARTIAYFRKRGRPGQARRIVEGRLRPDCEEIALEYPVTTEIAFDDPRYGAAMESFYAGCAERLAARLTAGRDVVLLCEGDPFLYGSYMHMHERLAERFPVEVVPGVSGMSGCWTRAQLPMTYGTDVLTVLPATLGRAELARRLAATDAAVIMKLGHNLPRVRAALGDAGLIGRAVYVERGTMPGERVVPLAELGEDVDAPYFAIVLVPACRHALVPEAVAE